MSTNADAPKMAAIRAVFTAMFDAVDVAGDFDEGRWQDLIAAFNATGRLVFGWPHLESSESDIFGALDDIAFQLTEAKLEIERTTADARIILGELRQEIGMEERPPEPDAPPPSPEPPIEHESVEEPPSEALGEPTSPDDDQTPANNITDQPVSPDQNDLSALQPNENPVPRAPKMPERTGSHRGHYRKPYTSEEIAEYYRTHTRDETAHRFNTTPSTVKRRVAEWEAESGEPRRGDATPHAPLRVVDLPPIERAPDPPLPPEAQGFDARRQESAREASERTWRERHPEQTSA